MWRLTAVHALFFTLRVFPNWTLFPRTQAELTRVTRMVPQAAIILLADSLYKWSPPNTPQPSSSLQPLSRLEQREGAMSQLIREQFMVKSMEENNKIKEIMARYRPIAPMPPLAPAPALDDPPMKSCGTSTPLYLQSRPCRVRKRGRPSLTSFQVAKRSKPLICASTSTDSVAMTTRANSFVPYTTQVPVSAHGFLPVPVSTAKIPVKTVQMTKDPLTLSLVPYSGSTLMTAIEIKKDAPVERDLLKKLMEPKEKVPELIRPKVLVPQPIKPVGSSIYVGCIDPIVSSAPSDPIRKTPGEVEQEMEAETLPAVISDSQNKVRLTNSAYKELVDQPECLWLETVVKNSCKRLNGEVKLVVTESMVPDRSTGFTCRVKIEWPFNGIRSYVCALCDVRRLYCDSRDYLFIWKFRTSEGYVSSCKAWIKDGAVW
jgi:hypothetical protein